MNTQNVVKTSLMILFMEILGISVGLGGGFVHILTLVSSGLNPRVAAVTIMFLGLFSPPFSVLTLSVQNLIKIDFALWLTMFSVCGTVVGNVIIQ